MKATRMNHLEWSPWHEHDFAPDHFSFLHHWREATHPSYHRAEVWQFRKNGRTQYEAYVQAGPYGETGYLRKIFNRAKDARLAVEMAVQAALAAGDMTI